VADHIRALEIMRVELGKLKEPNHPSPGAARTQFPSDITQFGSQPTPSKARVAQVKRRPARLLGDDLL
jgi:hypothetical protein